MRKMKRFMAFALSAVVMLTMVNTPVVTARAQSQEVASVAEAEKKVEKVEIQQRRRSQIYAKQAARQADISRRIF